MTVEDIYECFKDDSELMNYFDPQSKAKNNYEACVEIYDKLIDLSKDYRCVFRKCELGYIFYSGKLLMSFCVKPKYRDRENLKVFSDFIKAELGSSFSCYLYNTNTRAIKFLQKIGLRISSSNNLITLLYI